MLTQTSDAIVVSIRVEEGLNTNMLEYSNMMLDKHNNTLDGYNRREWLWKALGISICLIGAILMYQGKLLGVNTPGYATVLGIIGIGIIANSGKRT